MKKDINMHKQMAMGNLNVGTKMKKGGAVQKKMCGGPVKKK